MDKIRRFLFIAVFVLFAEVQAAPYYGKFLGKLSELHHGVSGEVYVVDGRTLYLKDFTYDGQGPAAYFYASSSKNADRHGFRLRDENGSPEVIRRYRKEGVTLTLPEGKTLNSIKIFYVWCEEFEVNFGDIKIPRHFDFPRPQKIEALRGVHAIASDNIVIVDAQTLLIPNLSYDGEAPDAKFWVGRGPKPSPQGIRVPDENGKEVPLRRYDRKTVVLTLPGDLTIFDIGHFGIWCEAFTVDFGHVQIPQNLNVPPSLRQLGVSPQSKLNCEVLYDDLAFEVRWAIAGDSIVLQLVAKLDDREYMSFGVSGDDSRSEMIGGDVAVAGIDKRTLKGFAEDYYLGAKSQCSGPTGSCPDSKLKENSNNVLLLNAALVNGYSIVTYQRPLKPSDEFDRQIHTNHSQAIIWAIGPLNQRNEVSFHTHYTKGNKFIDFGRPAKWNCPMPEGVQPVTKKQSNDNLESTTTKSRKSDRRKATAKPKQETVVEDNERSASRARPTSRGTTRRGSASTTRSIPTPAPVVKRDAWDIPAIQCYEPEDGVFYAQMGPTGGKRGYSAITGHVGWGISWYINGLLIPEINVVRGKTYTFVVEGGSDAEIPAKYHPFYITDDPIGGYEYKTQEERQNVRILAGAVLAKDGSVQPTGTGRLCHWTQQGDLEADDFESFGAYQRTLELKCDQGEPGVIQWIPDENTPDTVYYQCFTHRYLGWKINVHDSCDEQASSNVEQIAKPSNRIESRVKPDFIIPDKEDTNNTTISEQYIASVISSPHQADFYHNQNSFIPSRDFISQESRVPNFFTKNQSFLLGMPYRKTPYNKRPIPRPQQSMVFVVKKPLYHKPKPLYRTQRPAALPTYSKLILTQLLPTTTEHDNQFVKMFSTKTPFNQRPSFEPASIVVEKGFVPIIKKDHKIKRDEEPLAEAAEKIESYYLPPLKTPPPSNPIVQQRSNIDIEDSPSVDLASPPDVVVTYDGRRVSGASLTAKISDRSSILDQRASKAAELIKARPQFVPFKGELPPLNPSAISRNAQIRDRGIINRDLDTPLAPLTTKLRPVQ